MSPSPTGSRINLGLKKRNCDLNQSPQSAKAARAQVPRTPTAATMTAATAIPSDVLTSPAPSPQAARRMALSLPCQRSPPRLGDAHARNLDCAPARDDALGGCRREPG